MGGLNWKKSMHREGRTFLVGCDHGTSLLQEEIKIEPPRQVTTMCCVWRYLLTDNAHANELSKRLCCFYTVIISVFKCLGGVWKLWAKGNLVE